MNYLRCAAAWSAALVSLSVGSEARLIAQGYAPVQPGGGIVVPFASPVAEGTGNPFLRRGPSRASLMQQSLPQSVPQRFDNQVAPVTYEQPLAPVAPQPLAPQPVAQPNVPPPQPFVPPAEVAPVTPPQQLHGIALLTAADPNVPNEHPLAPVIRWADDALVQMQGLQDYSCTFTKRENVDGRLQEQQVMYAKVRHQPYSVYLQFLAPNDVKGQEALYVAGRNQGRLLAHAVGFKAIAGTISLAPTDPQAMDGNRHPITDFGVHRLVERVREGSMQDSQYGECNVRIIPGAHVGDRACTCIEVSHPVQRAEFRYHLTRLYVDDQLNVPLHYESYGWPQPGQKPPLLEDYTYQGLRPNVGLSDVDFDVKNPNYRF